MTFVSRHLGRWPVALACVIALAAAILLPGLGSFGLFEPQERQLADKVAPRAELAAKQQAMQPPPGAPPTKTDTCDRMAPKDPVARSLTNRAMVFGRDHLGDGDAGRRMPLALLGFLTVLAAAGIAMRVAGARAGVLTALVLLSMPLLVFQSRQLLSDIGIAAGAALTLYGLVALGTTPSRSRVLAFIDALVAVVALCSGIALGFLAGGALLGVVVPLGAFAAATGLGVGAAWGATRAIGFGAFAAARTVAPRVGIGRAFVPPRAVTSWVMLGGGIALIFTGVLFCGLLQTFGDESMAYGLVATGGPLAMFGGFQLARDHENLAALDAAKSLISTLAVAGLVALLAYQLFSLAEPQPGLTPPQRALLGKAIVATGCWSPVLGGLWRPEDDLRYSFDSTFEQIAYGTFPWGVLGPVAMFALLSSRNRRRRMLGGLTLAWGAGAWVAAEVFQRKVSFTLYGGFPALAIAIGVWLDGVLRTRGRDDDSTDANDDADELPSGALMLVGLFALLAVINLGKDLQSFPERITSLLVGSDSVTYPKTSKLAFIPTRLWFLLIGGTFALGFALAMIAWRDNLRARIARKVARVGLVTALSFTAIFSAFLAFAWQPRLATHVSSKAMFDTFTDLAKQGDQLVVMGDMGDAPGSYAPDAKVEQVSTRDQVVQAIGRTNRVFAIAPQTELCQLHREIGGKPYFVIDDRNTRSILLSNKIDGATDKNPLRTSILHEPPANIQYKPKGRVVFDNKVELMGWNMPRAVDRGDKFTVTTFYKVLAPVGGNWRVLYHFDGALRFNGDHEPIKGRCQTATWQPGDYIVDTHTVTAGAGAFTPGAYDVWTGFFSGSAPNWRNMTVSEAPADMRDTADRVKITTITLQ